MTSFLVDIIIYLFLTKNVPCEGTEPMQCSFPSEPEKESDLLPLTNFAPTSNSQHELQRGIL